MIRSTSRLLSAAAIVVAASIFPVSAQTPPAQAPQQAAPAKGKAPPKKATTPEGIECSAQADAKDLKGKERRAFRSKCIRALKKKGSGSGK